ncbi:kinesin-like protein KIN-4C [Impatiens glandulifera]|uniref:kinesin-like protein KIN-4C n=1 Tax=Impatiens glandulifera TaxID=253017 RepID=UPI001FB09FBF|nr:kinesin-like protein KIN-4C [Impatiens glandulifera]
MDSDAKDSSQSVTVAVNIRPLVTSELLVGCTDCISVVNGEPQVQIGSHTFTFDYVFGNRGSPSTQIYDQCVGSIVESLFQGYNGTVLAYGQTGSGKTYTMGTNYNGEDHGAGIIPKVMQTIFSKIETKKNKTEFLIRVSFIEIFKEEVFDLLDPNTHTLARGDGAKPSGPSRAPIQIRETTSGGITLAGVTEAEVRTKEEMASYLLRGSAARATGSTNMNSQSSRSHAIFTISLEQRRTASCTAGIVQDDDILCAKLHLVDLAGSERAKRTGADGTRFQEGIHINKGLLALGNVISALGDEKKRKEGGHVPYRDSKLTRLLQDSLGGNCKTVMIACVSPADTNAEETLNTLKYANRARNIQNKAIINRDPVTAEMQKMRSQIEQLQTELLYFQGDSGTSFEEFQMLKKRISLLEASNANLKREFQESESACKRYSQLALDAQVEKDKLLMIIELARNGKPWDEIDSNLDQDVNLLKNYVGKIHELETEVLRLQNTIDSKQQKHNGVDSFELDVDEICPKSFMDMNEFSSNPDIKSTDIDGEAEFEAKELEHSSLQENLDRELKELDQKLEQKEAEMKRFANSDTSVKQHYEKKVHELEQEKRVLQNEIDLLKHSFSNISSNTDESAQRLKEDYLQKLNLLEAQVAELKKKQDAQAQLLRQKQKSDDAAKRLQDEIRRIKSQKVQLQQKIKQESEQFRIWKASREKEVLQLKKEGRRNQYEMHKLLALNQRQKMVLQRKSEEAAMATKRLKDLLESKKTSSRMSIGSGPSTQVLMQTIEHELEVVVRVHEVRAEYERQMEERARMAKEVAELKEAQSLNQINLSYYPQAMSPGARNSRIYALENMLATSSRTLVSMASQLSEAEERERAFSSKGRWNQIRALPEAKTLLNHLFDLASSSRCLSRDKEVDCKEKDCEIRDLKEKIVKLARQMEMQKLAFIRQEKLQNLTTNQSLKRSSMNSEASTLNEETHIRDLRKKGARARMNGSSTVEIEDMDISEGEHSDMDEGSDWEPFKTEKRLNKKQPSRTESNGNMGIPLVISDSEADPTPDGTNSEKPNESAICCTCSKSSLCKTVRCECRANKNGCHSSCNCSANKCKNRDEENEKLHESSNEEKERDQDLASQGAMLLESAMKDHKITDIADANVSKRKPLSDIGNTAKPSMKKKWKRSSIQLIPMGPPTEQGSAEITEKHESSSNAPNIPPQLPRPTSNVVSNSNNPLRVRNSKPHGNIPISGGGNKEADPPAPKSPKKQQRTIDEKENQGL